MDRNVGRIGDDIANRLLEFANAALQIVGTLPRNPTGKHIAGQLIRSCSSGGANYEEARSAESRTDFAHKVLVAAKEVRESCFWLRLVRRGQLSRYPDFDRVLAEGNELIAILTASARTARSRAG
jgi:four helix bundle protein